MKKILLLSCAVLLLGNVTGLKAQCYGTVNFDNAVGLNGSDTGSITTSYCKELIMISYDGWPQPGAGPVTVDGNPATHIATGFDKNNSGIAETYAYIAPAAGVHKIACTETNYSYPPYGLNFAADFYATGTGNPLTIASLTNFTIATITCTTGGTITSNITTTIPNTMIYCNWENNNGQGGPFTDTWTGATKLGQLHEGNGIDASHAYEPAPTPAAYTFTVTNNALPNNGCGGLVLVLVAIPPPLCGGGGNLNASATKVNPTCGLCNGSINVSASGGASPYTYNWSPNVGNDSDESNLCAGIYTITITDAACHDTTIFDTLPQTVQPLKPRDTLTTNEKCNGDCNGITTMSVTGGTAPYTYLWNGGQTTSTISNLCAQVYTFTVTDINGCSATATATITQPQPLTATTTVKNVLCNGASDGSATGVPAGGTAPYKYSWSDPNTQTTATAGNLSAGTYTVTVTDSRGCTTTATATLTQPTAVSVTLTGPAIICEGVQGTLKATPAGGTPGYKYAWNGPGVIGSPTGDSCSILAMTQTDTVTVFDANGCTASAQISVQLGPLMTVSITGPASICQGLSTTLCSNVQGGTGGNMYTWQPGNAQTPCANVGPASTTTYSVSVVDNCGTTATASYTLRINPLPVTAFTSSLFSGCAPLCVQFYNTTTLAQGNSSTYLWTFGNGDSARTENPIYCYQKSGVYSINLSVTSDSGCSNTLNKLNYITAFARPNTAFTYSPQPATILTPTVQFINQSNDPYGIVSWIWNFGDATDSISNATNPVHTYQDTGRYCVSMIAMDEHGCADTATNCFVIEPNYTLYIPSAFTPNGDSKNPTFEPKGEYIKSFEMYIFDRWGMQVYHTTDINQGWDGTVNGGTPSQEDTYIYRIQVTDAQKHEHTYVGSVTVLK